MPAMPYPAERFKRLFSIKSIESAYDNFVSKKPTRGLDRIGIKTFNRDKKEHFQVIYRKCNKGTYRFTPYVEKLLSKGRGKLPRVISVATMRDRIVLYLLKEFMHQVFPLSVNRRLPNDYIREIKEFDKSNGQQTLCYFKGDIKSFYDSINRLVLMSIIRAKVKSPKILTLLKLAVSTPTVPLNSRSDRGQYKTDKGIPQGLAISNILANIYLHQLDQKFQRYGLKYFRYVDDILFFVQEENADELETEITRDLTELDLNLSKRKTECNISNCPYDYLGYHLELPKVTIREQNIGCRYFLSGVMRHAVVLDPGSRESLYLRCRRGVASPIFVYNSKRDPSRC